MKKKINKYLIPNIENNHQPHLLREKSTLAFIGAILFFEVIGLVLFSNFIPGTFNNMAAVMPSVLVSKVNEERQDLSKNQLIVSEKLTEAAQLKANDMASKSYFAHVSPEGKDPWSWLREVNYSFKNAGENLAVNFVDSEDVHKAWMNSPTHKANIVRDGFTEIGIATAEGKYKGKDAIFVAQFFGQPQDSNILSANVQDSIRENSFVQKVISSPKTILSYILYVIGAIFALALLLKVFVNINIQYPRLIVNGLIIILFVILIILINELITSNLSKIL